MPDLVTTLDSSPGELIAGSFTDSRFDPTNSSDYDGFIRTVGGLPDRAAFYTLYDLNGDGAISQDELAAGLVYASTAGNPHGAVNYDRLYQSALGAQQTRSNGLSLFLQDTFNATDRLSFNVGVRSERFAHMPRRPGGRTLPGSTRENGFHELAAGLFMVGYDLARRVLKAHPFSAGRSARTEQLPCVELSRLAGRLGRSAHGRFCTAPGEGGTLVSETKHDQGSEP